MLAVLLGLLTSEGRVAVAPRDVETIADPARVKGRSRVAQGDGYTGSAGSVFPGDGAVGTHTDYVHDPTVIQFRDRYFCFSTSGNGFGVLRSSRDLKNWTVQGSILPDTPDWLKERYRHRSLWAPDVLVLGDKLRMYYCASNFGTNASVIGVAECDRFDPNEPLKGWHDLGLVFESKPGKDTYNAIDPEVAVDEAGRHWMFFGSYFAGIYVVELDPASGRLKNPEKPEPILVARNTGEQGNPLEGSAVARRDGFYYLFVSYGLAAQGVRSTYRVMVGRSRSVTGPFVDASGTSMVDGGHTEVLKTSPPMFSPGHTDVLQERSGRWLMPYHFYDGRHLWQANLWGRPNLQVRELLWSRDGWPLPGLPVEFAVPRSRARIPEGRWVHQADFGEPRTLFFEKGGVVRDGDARGTWTEANGEIVLTLPRENDRVQLAYGGAYYVGRDSGGHVVRGIREGR